MDIIRHISVTFPDCSESSVLDAAIVVTAMSYNFSVEFTLFAIFYRQIIISSFKIYELKNVGSAAKYFLFLLCRSTEFVASFLDFSVFFFSLYQHISINFSSNYSLCNAS